jgi:hypothetical protein
MKMLLRLAFLLFVSLGTYAQSFEVSGLQESYKGLIGETIKAPIRFKNITDKAIILVIRKSGGQLGGTQKNYFCIDNNCLDQRIEDYIVKIEPGQTLNSFNVVLDAGLASGVSSVKYIAYSKSNPSEIFDIELNFVVEEKPERDYIYSSNIITLHTIYPNPVVDYAYVDYKLNDDQVKAKIIIHNILGNSLDEYVLLADENKVKLRAESLNSGIYFYTLYLDNESVVTRKLIVKK